MSAPNARHFARASFDTVDSYASTSVAYRFCPKAKRDRITRIVLSEWEMLCPGLTELPADVSAGDFRSALTANVKARMRDEKWGFVWWLPILFAVVEIIIKILIERWLAT
jgi:hypothetical protein